MSFGFSVGDFFAVGKLAWNVYKSCKEAGGAFVELSHEVIALHTAIKELEDEIENPNSIFNRTGASKKKELGVLVKNCNGVLQQLNKKLIKYKSLGSASKRTWDRLRWGAENLQEIREKLLAHTSSLTLFLTTLGTGSLGRIEKKLDQLIEDVRAGRREQTVLTFAAGEDDPDESEPKWDLLKEELVEEGFSKPEIEGHKHWIKAKLTELIENNGLDEQVQPENDDSSTTKQGSLQPPKYTVKDAEALDSPKALRKSSETVEAQKPITTVGTKEYVGGKKKIYGAGNTTITSSKPLDKSLVSPEGLKQAALLQPTVEDADEDEEITNENPVGTIDGRQTPAEFASGSQVTGEGIVSEETDSDDEAESRDVNSEVGESDENKSKGGVFSEEEEEEEEASDGEAIETERTRRPVKAATVIQKYPKDLKSAKHRPANEKDPRAKQRLKTEVDMPNQDENKNSRDNDRNKDEDSGHRTAYVEEDSSDGTDDINLATILPTDSISQVGFSPPESNSRGDSPEFARLDSDVWAKVLKPQPFVSPNSNYQAWRGHPRTDYGDDGYGYTNPRGLVVYDLNNTSVPRHHARRKCFDDGRAAGNVFDVSDDEPHIVRQKPHPQPPPNPPSRPKAPEHTYVGRDGRAIPLVPQEEQPRKIRNDDSLYHDDNPYRPYRPYRSRHEESRLRNGADRPSNSKGRSGNEEHWYDYRPESFVPAREPAAPLPRGQAFQDVPPLPRATTFQDSSRGYAPFTPNSQPKSPEPRTAFEVPPSRNQKPRASVDATNQGAGGFKFSNPEDIFADFLRQSGGSQEFDDIFSQTPRGTGPNRTATPPPVTIVERPVILTLDELFRGTHKKMKVKRRVFDEVTGRKTTQERILEFDIKPGLLKGSKIKFKGVGDQEEGGMQDLHFIVKEKEHPLYTRDVADLHLTLELSLVDSLCGFRRTVTTIDGKMIAIEKVGPTEPESTDTYPSLGMPLSKKPDQRGNFIVKYKVKYPETLNKRQQVQIRQILYDSPRV